MQKVLQKLHGFPWEIEKKGESSEKMGVVKKKPKGHIEMHSAHNGVKYFLFDFDFKNIRGEQLRNFVVSWQLALKLKNTLIGVSN